MGIKAALGGISVRTLQKQASMYTYQHWRSLPREQFDKHAAMFLRRYFALLLLQPMTPGKAKGRDCPLYRAFNDAYAQLKQTNTYLSPARFQELWNRFPGPYLGEITVDQASGKVLWNKPTAFPHDPEAYESLALYLEALAPLQAGLSAGAGT